MGNGHNEKPREAGAKELAFGVGGIYFFFVLFGILQEQINKGDYDGEQFTTTLFLIFTQCCFNAIVGFAFLTMSAAPAEEIPATAFLGMSASYISAMFCSNFAIQHVSYPTQVLVKSCKMIPVMLVNMIRGTKRYNLQEKLCVLLITAGIATFMLNKPSGGKGGGESTYFGIALCLASLAFDGYTGGSQDALKKAHSPSSHQLMFYMNSWSVALLFVALAVTGQGSQGLGFVARHPAIIKDLALFSLASAAGQFFIFYTITNFGALPCATVTTTRKFFTILASVVFYGHAITGGQWLGVAIVFAALGWNLNSKRGGGGKK